MDKYELYHHGIKGMKWGVRRYQNKDGSLTAAGKKRQRGWSEDAKTADDISRKSVKAMSNAELRKLNERTQLETNYKNLHPGAVKKGMRFVTTAAAFTGTALALYGNADKLVKLGKTAGSKFVDIAGNMVVRDINRRLG